MSRNVTTGDWRHDHGARARQPLWSLLLVALLLCSAVPSLAQVSDDFSATTLDTNLWQLTDSRGDGQLLLSPGLLTLDLPAGWPHDAGAADNHTLRLLQDLPDSSFSLEARFESVPGTAGQQQGLMVLQDDGTYVRLFHRHDGQQLNVGWTRTVNHQILEHGTLAVTATDTLALRLTRLDNIWTCDQQIGGGAWSEVFVFDHALRVSHGGVYAATSLPKDFDTPYDRHNPPVDKSSGGASAPAYAAIIDYVFDTDNPIVPEDGALSVGTRTFTGLESFYYFRAGSPGTVFDYAGTTAPYHLTQLDTLALTQLPGHGLSLDTATLITSPRPAQALNNAIVATGEITMEAWLQPSTIGQSGPARIVTLSNDPSNRNASLSHGQWDDVLPTDVFDARLRTTEQSLNGQPDFVTPTGSLTGALQHVVYTRDLLGNTRFYVDGLEVATGLAEGDLSNWNPNYALALGGEMDNSRNWLGNLHLTAIYSRALDAAEVAQNFLAGPDGGVMPLLAPAVILSNVVAGSMFDFTDTIAMSAVANDADGTIAAVEFRVGAAVLHRDETAPYEFDWTNPGTGVQQIQAVAIDNDGLETGSEVIPVYVSAPASYQAALHLSDAFFDADLGAPWTLTDTSAGAVASQSNGSVNLALPAATQIPWDASLAGLRAHQDELDTDLALELMIDGDAWLGDGFTGLEVADSLGATVRYVAQRSTDVWTLSWGSASLGSPVQSGSLELGTTTGPLWLQLRRQADTCQLFYSGNGLVWQAAGTIAQPLALNRAGWFAGTLSGPATIALDHAFNLAAPIVPEDGQSGDFDGPVISLLTVLPDFNSLTLDWVTDEPADYRVEYGLTTAYELGLIDGGLFSFTHQAVLPALSPGLAYHIRLTCLDVAGNLTDTGDLVYYTDVTATPAAGPAAGDVYRETILGFDINNFDWRVTDPNAQNIGAAEFLPNQVLSLNVPDLTGAVRAELVIDRWGGHPGTTGKKIRLNNGSWLHVDDPATIPDDQPECYVYQDNPMIEVPLEQLVAGSVTLEGSAGGQTCYNFDWGQWGWYAVVLRVYYDGSVPHPDGSFLSPALGDTITDSASISVNATSIGVVNKVHVLARYEGFDGDGDGVTGGWHRHYRRERDNTTVNLEGIVGTDLAAPFDLTWDAAWIPDQAPGTVGLQARIRDDSGVWFVTELDSLSLNHSNGVVKSYPMLDVPRSFWVRTGQTKAVTFNIPATDSLSGAAEARVTATTWNGSDGGVILINNNPVASSFGRDHYFSLDSVAFSPSILDPADNILSIYSATSDHGMEMLWPGPLVTVRYGPAAPPANIVARQPGDTDGNGLVDDRDAQLMLDHLVGALKLTGTARAAADFDGNGVVEITDAALVLAPDAKSEGESGLLLATTDPDDPSRLTLGLDTGAGHHTLEMTITSEGLAAAVQKFEMLAESGAMTAWHASGDTLRLARVGTAVAAELGTLVLESGLGTLLINTTVDGNPQPRLEIAAPDIPSRFELVGNYPNPFNPSTTIAFNLPRTAQVRLRVHDLRGHLIATVADGSLPPGRHTAVWNGRDDQGRGVASGTFFYRLEAGGQVWTRKMLLLK